MTPFLIDDIDLIIDNKNLSEKNLSKEEKGVQKEEIKPVESKIDTFDLTPFRVKEVIK